ncbi:tRNA (adenosine(37)-N6)-dimethylallyltransferase MiaA [Comamonas sp. Y33R10-2]|uniref:tRNA (adenosine(37)-N6)-dimethylallyltransferase MiaA n=1 Tax=Comamonas sp. Y33R10-2 TaxID=2853257 RepID=UPI001C5C8A37|nr:tRNA (adenosine(37)-N6)-dimethylallyltransferase MiaA [Comamonas sp. Y33R10-2]QXZ10188.1 tRNA (adenosine(37)-N6)-dimethylallyltransferase MiaA [Comamonas sp. Y33R10-2]
MTASHPLPCIAIAGPTASGKTAAALALSELLAQRGQKTEIISVDSALVYKSMDIGTAKPSAAELAAVPHHLIDIIDPLQSYSAAEFVRDTQKLVDEIHARNAIPLLVGGTMLYFKALMDGLDDMPAADPAVRTMLDAQAAELGWPAMHAKLAEVDPTTATRLAPGDSQRIQRALEVWHVSGKPLSSFHTTKNKAGAAEQIGLAALFSLEPEDRKWLHQRIAQRFDLMLQQGFLDEVRQLRTRGDLHLDLPSMRCVGYRQAWEELDWQSAHNLPEINHYLLREKGIAATRQLAKRQITWLRSMPQRHAIACDAPDAQQQLLTAAMAVIDQAQRAAG